MIIETILNFSIDSDTAKVIIEKFFQDRKYRQLKSRSMSMLSFSKGSRSGSLYSFSPDDWKRKVDIKFLSEHKIKIYFEINTSFIKSGVVALPWERNYWRKEIEDLCYKLNNTGSESQTSSKALKSSKWLNIFVGVPVALIIVVPVATAVVVLPLWLISTILGKFTDLSETNRVLIGMAIYYPLAIWLIVKFAKKLDA